MTAEVPRRTVPGASRHACATFTLFRMEPGSSNPQLNEDAMWALPPSDTVLHLLSLVALAHRR